MRLLINIPKEFEQHFKQDAFEDSLHRLSTDAHLIAGIYEQETAKMLRDSFKNAIPISPHGRLIDADALINALQELFDRRNKDAEYTGFRGASVSWNDAICYIKDAPTIIEAEGECVMNEILEPKYAPYTGMFGCGINHPRCKEDCYWYREEIDMGAHIPYCTCKTKFPIEPDDCKDCDGYHSKYHPTNADAMRAMSDEKLAEELLRIFASFCKAQWSREYVLDWLRQEKESA